MENSRKLAATMKERRPGTALFTTAARIVNVAQGIRLLGLDRATTSPFNSQAFNHQHKTGSEC